MIARVWKGAVRKEDTDAYSEYMQETGVAGYARTPGNRGVWMLRRDVGERTEFMMFTLWDSLAAVKSFAGEKYERAGGEIGSESLSVIHRSNLDAHGLCHLFRVQQSA